MFAKKNITERQPEKLLHLMNRENETRAHLEISQIRNHDLGNHLWDLDESPIFEVAYGSHAVICVAIRSHTNKTSSVLIGDNLQQNVSHEIFSVNKKVLCSMNLNNSTTAAEIVNTRSGNTHGEWVRPDRDFSPGAP